MEDRMAEQLQFSSRTLFRNWLEDNCLSSPGVWLLFSKAAEPKTLTAGEALEEALCFGWIDGQMQSIDENSYIKYFSQRRKNSKWSQRNKALAEKLEQRGDMTRYGRAKIEQAKENGQWDAPKPPDITEEQIAELTGLLSSHESAYTNFLAMSSSVQKTYTRAYYDAKTQDTRDRRLLWMIDRLNKNLKPM